MDMNPITGTEIYSEREIQIEDYVRKVPRIRKPRGNPGRKESPTIINMVCCFDIETTYLPDLEQSFMYVWQFQLGEYTIMGRTWDEFQTLISRVRKGVQSNERLVVYVHNLSFLNSSFCAEYIHLLRMKFFVWIGVRLQGVRCLKQSNIVAATFIAI